MKLLESEKSIFDFDCDKKHSADYIFDDITVEINGTKLTDNPTFCRLSLQSFDCLFGGFDTMHFT